MKYLIGLILLVFLYFTYGLYIGQKDFVVGPRDLKREHPPGLFDYRGILDVQTEQSAGWIGWISWQYFGHE